LTDSNFPKFQNIVTFYMLVLSPDRFFPFLLGFRHHQAKAEKSGLGMETSYKLGTYVDIK